jgi:hypothetical protein
MSHMRCVARQNKLETPKEKDEVNKREVHECVECCRNSKNRVFIYKWIKKDERRG